MSYRDIVVHLTLDPVFAKSRPAFAVNLAGGSTSDPASTPIAWTRGLQPDGTWALHSPYGRQGGHIVFLGGNVVFYDNVRDQLARYDGRGVTSNILEALPPGARIGEYIPTAAEQAAWAKIRRAAPGESIFSRAGNSRTFLFGMAAAWLFGVVGLVIYLSKRRRA